MKNFNVILILLDGARVDRLHKFPIFEELANDGTFFSQMITHAPYTLVSMNSIFTGMYGGRNGINAYYQMFSDPHPDCFTLAEYLSKNGWFTCGDAMRLSLISNRGFDKLTSQEDDDDPNFLQIHSKILEQILSEKKPEQPFFAYFHYPKIHHLIKEHVFDIYDDFSEEYFSNKETNMKNYDTYLGEAADYFQKFYKFIKEKKLHENSIIIVMADHGMGVGEKIGERAYGIFTYDYSIKTFSYLIQPKIFPKNKEISKLTETIDILPTILDSLEIDQKNTGPKIQGKNLFIVEESNITDERFSFSETGGVEGPWPSPKEPNVKCIRNMEWKLIHNSTPDTWEMYNLVDDPDENNNLVDINSAMFQKLKTKMGEIINSSV